jgi:hypothetical protein
MRPEADIQGGSRMRYVYPALFLLLAACATGNVRQNFSMEKAKAQGHGLLVGSYSVSAYDSSYPAYMKFFYEPLGTPKGPHMNIPHFDANSGCDNLYEGDSDFSDVCAHLFVIDLPAGDYEMTGWSVENDLHVHFYANPWTPAKFTIQAGKSTYVGNIHMGILSGPNVWGFAGAWPFLHDERARDIPVLERKYPAINDSNTVVALLTFTEAPDRLKATDVPAPPPPRTIPKHKP